MKKKIIDYAVDIASRNPESLLPYQYTDEKHYFVTDGARLLETHDRVNQLELNAHDPLIQKMKTVMDSDSDRDLDYHIHHIPSKTEIKDSIKELVGRKFDRIYWSDGTITVNARYLLKAMDVLNAKVCYVSKDNTGRMPIFLYEKDDPQNSIKVAIYQVRNFYYRTGFWVAEEQWHG